MLWDKPVGFWGEFMVLVVSAAIAVFLWRGRGSSPPDLSLAFLRGNEGSLDVT